MARRVASALRASLGAAAAVGFGLSCVEATGGLAYLCSLYGGLGAEVWPAVATLAALLGASLAALAYWGLGVAPASVRRWRGRALVGAMLAGVLAGVWSYQLPRLDESGGAALDERSIAGLARLIDALPPGRTGPLGPLGPVGCEASVGERAVTLVAFFQGRQPTGKAQSACVQASSVGAAVGGLSRALRARGVRAPVELEVITGSEVVSGRHAWIDGLKLRPGLDGVCTDSRCLMPWQLLARDLHSSYQLLQAVPDLRLGVSGRAVRRELALLEGDRVAGLRRISTRTYVLDPAEPEGARVVELRRGARRRVPLDAATLLRASAAAREHILRAQLPTGVFRYTLNPYSGAEDTRSFNLARQAGAVLVLCELSPREPAVRRAVEAGLAALRPYERRAPGELLGYTLTTRERRARLASLALPLVSMLTCADDLARSADERRIEALARTVLRLQRPAGNFAPLLDLTTGEPVVGPLALYAQGQAVLALVLLERHLGRAGDPRGAERVRAAVDRAMSYFSTRHWAHPLADYFFLEENWHCLAARAALAVHRNAGYERFCLQYVGFKSRLILNRQSGAASDFDGGFGFGNVVPPNNTGSAGFGEALAAALAIRKATSQPNREQERLLERVLSFLLRQQWDAQTCFACASGAAWGGVSEQTRSPVVRIDFVQHSLAAWGHGGRVLGLLPDPAPAGLVSLPVSPTPRKSAGAH